MNKNKGKVVKIQDGCFNDIITIKLDDGTKVESRGWDMGVKGNPILKRGDIVEFVPVVNSISGVTYAHNLKKKEPILCGSCHNTAFNCSCCH